MRTFFSYFLIICLALSSFSGSVAYAYSPVMSAHSSQVQSQPTIAASHSEHAMQQAFGLIPDTSEDHDCCMQEQQSCDESLCANDTCPKHCAVATALLQPSLFSYTPATSASNEHLLTLAKWLFFKDPPPPINT